MAARFGGQPMADKVPALSRSSDRSWRCPRSALPSGVGWHLGQVQHKHTRVNMGCDIQRSLCRARKGTAGSILTRQKLNANLLERFVYYLVLAPEILMYFRCLQMCLSTGSLMIRQSSSCRNASLSCEFDTISGILSLCSVTSPCSGRQDPLLPATVVVPFHPVFILQKG